MKTKSIDCQIFIAEQGSNVVLEINEWISKNHVRVLNIETVQKLDGNRDAARMAMNLKSRLIKVWFEPLTEEPLSAR